MPTKTHSLLLNQPWAACLRGGETDIGPGKIVIQQLFVENGKFYIFWLSGFVANFVPAPERRPPGWWVLVAAGIS